MTKGPGHDDPTGGGSRPTRPKRKGRWMSSAIKTRPAFWDLPHPVEVDLRHLSSSASLYDQRTATTTHEMRYEKIPIVVAGRPEQGRRVVEHSCERCGTVTKFTLYSRRFLDKEVAITGIGGAAAIAMGVVTFLATGPVEEGEGWSTVNKAGFGVLMLGVVLLITCGMVAWFSGTGGSASRSQKGCGNRGSRRAVGDRATSRRTTGRCGAKTRRSPSGGRIVPPLSATT